MLWIPTACPLPISSYRQFRTHTSEGFQYSAPLGSSAISHRSLLSCFSSYNMPAWHFVYLFCGVASFNCKYFRTNEVEAQYSDPLIHLKLLYLFEDLDIVHSFYFSPHVFIFLFSYSFCVHFPQKGTFGEEATVFFLLASFKLTHCVFLPL